MSAREGDGWARGAGMTRRGALGGAAGLGALLLGGCGFRPLHAPPGGAGGDPGITGELAATRVALVQERFGQLLRRGLQQRLGAASGGRAAEARWELVTIPALTADLAGFLSDGSATRVRYLATTNWQLTRIGSPTVVANGFERATEAFNVQPNQFFAADLSRDAAERRLADVIADQVVTRLALRFRSMRAGEAPQLIEPVPPPVMTEPTMPGSLDGLPTPGPGGGLEGGIGGAGGPLGVFR